jgi:hypothetical protein
MKTVIEMAREAGLRDCTCNGEKGCLERFAELVRNDERDRAMRENAYVQAEREACAKVLDEMAEDMEREMEPSTAIAYVRSKAATIRARGKT